MHVGLQTKGPTEPTCLKQFLLDEETHKPSHLSPLILKI